MLNRVQHGTAEIATGDAVSNHIKVSGLQTAWYATGHTMQSMSLANVQ